MSSSFCGSNVVVSALLGGEHSAPDVGGDLTLEAAHGFVSSLAFFDLAVEVPMASAVAHAHLGDRDEVQRRVQFAIPAT